MTLSGAPSRPSVSPDEVLEEDKCPNAGLDTTFYKTTSPNAKQLQALDLLRKITL